MNLPITLIDPEFGEEKRKLVITLISSFHDMYAAPLARCAEKTDSNKNPCGSIEGLSKTEQNAKCGASIVWLCQKLTNKSQEAEPTKSSTHI